MGDRDSKCYDHVKENLLEFFGYIYIYIYIWHESAQYVNSINRAMISYRNYPKFTNLLLKVSCHE